MKIARKQDQFLSGKTVKMYNGNYVPSFLRITGVVDVQEENAAIKAPGVYKSEVDYLEEYRLLLEEGNLNEQ